MDGKRPVFGIFEGGGAKGFAHIGALHAAEANGLEFIGVAGASAGAIVATLVAAGFNAARIMNADRREDNILERHHSSPVALLGETRWRRFRRFRRGVRRFAMATMLGGIAGGIIVAPRTAMVALGLRRRRGYFSTEPIRSFVNMILREQLIDLHANHGMPSEGIPERIRFSDFDYEKFPQLRPLKIVATDLASGCLMVFDRHLTPDAEIAEAVAASVAIPMIFEPVEMTSYPGGPFADGGLVSNLPIWVFAEEKLAFERANPGQPPVPIIGFMLVEKDSQKLKLASRDRPFINFVLAVTRTAIFGSQLISHRFIEDLHVVPLETDLSVLDFDASWQNVQKAVIAGRRCAAQRLKMSLTLKPDRVRYELRRIHDLALAIINKLRKEDGRTVLTSLRANLVERFRTASLRVTHGLNMDGDADDRLLLDSRGAGAPRAFSSKTFAFIKIGAALRRGELDYMTKYERALVRPHVRSAICVPVFNDVGAWAKPALERPDPLGVFCLDSDEDLENEFESTEIKDLLAIQSTVLSLVLAQR